jgi:hypothetical protein
MSERRDFLRERAIAMKALRSIIVDEWKALGHTMDFKSAEELQEAQAFFKRREREMKNEARKP